jgi:hypothetical protein
MMDEGQVFSAPKKRKGDIGEASDIVNQFAERGRKRALDLFLTALRFTGSLHRSIFGTKNLTLIGCQEDPTAWARSRRSSGPRRSSSATCRRSGPASSSASAAPAPRRSACRWPRR